MTDDNEKILTKIKKMLALANDLAASEGERDNALRMAYKLLAKHNLSMMDVDNHGKPEPRIDADNKCFGMPFARSVSNSIAKLFFCQCYAGQKINGTQIIYHFVGKESNATTAMLLSDWIIKSILKECRARYKHNLSPLSRAFALGASTTLMQRVDELMVVADKAYGEPGTGMVLASLYRTEQTANDDFIAASGVKLKTKNLRSASVNTAAYGAGKDFGHTINLDKQLDGSSQKVLS